MPIDRETARLRSTIAVNAKWAKEADRTAATAPARQGFLDKLMRQAREQLGPDATDEQVRKAADNALQAHYARMRLNSLLKRRRAAAEKQAAMADAIIEASPHEAA